MSPVTFAVASLRRSTRSATVEGANFLMYRFAYEKKSSTGLNQALYGGVNITPFRPSFSCACLWKAEMCVWVLGIGGDLVRSPTERYKPTRARGETLGARRLDMPVFPHPL